MTVGIGMVWFVAAVLSTVNFGLFLTVRGTMAREARSDLIVTTLAYVGMALLLTAAAVVTKFAP